MAIKASPGTPLYLSMGLEGGISPVSKASQAGAGAPLASLPKPVLIAAAAIKTQISEQEQFAISARTKLLEAFKPELNRLYGETTAAEIIIDPSFFTPESLAKDQDALKIQIYALGNLKRRRVLINSYSPEIVKAAFAQIDADKLAKLKTGAEALDLPLFMKLMQACESCLDANKAKLALIKAEFREAFASDIVDYLWPKLPEGIQSGKDEFSEETFKVLIKACSLELVMCKSPIKEAQIGPLIIFYQKHEDKLESFDLRIKRMLCNLSVALTKGEIVRVKGSSSGVYFAVKRGNPRAVIKPIKEESFTEFCPIRLQSLDLRGVSGARMARMGILSGEASKKEHTAFLIDYAADRGFSEFPVTLMMELDHREPMVKEGHKTTKICSVQEFIIGTELSSVVDPCKQVSKEEWEKLASFSIDAGNLDCHFGNCLFANGKLIPIDAGMTRPDAEGLKKGKSEHTFDWKEIPVLREAVTPATKAYVARQSIARHAELLKELGYSKDVIELEKARMHLKKKAIAEGLNFFDLAMIMIDLESDGSSKDKYCEFQKMYENASRRSDIPFEKAWDDEVNRAIKVVKDAKASLDDPSKRTLLIDVLKLSMLKKPPVASKSLDSDDGL